MFNLELKCNTKYRKRLVIDFFFLIDKRIKICYKMDYLFMNFLPTFFRLNIGDYLIKIQNSKFKKIHVKRIEYYLLKK